jgi:hypothetical protein
MGKKKKNTEKERGRKQGKLIVRKLIKKLNSRGVKGGPLVEI